jgi:hypothetical protein
MANRKSLKKDINSITGDLVTECMIYQDIAPNADIKTAQDIIKELLAINQDFINRISHTEKGKAKAYYNSLFTSFNENIVGIIEKIAKLRK